MTCLSGLLHGFERLQDLLVIGPPVQLELHATDRIDQIMPIGGATQGLPERLQGLWWLRGLPLPDIAMTFADCAFDAATRSLDVSVTRPYGWAWAPNDRGRALYDGNRATQLTYRVKLDSPGEYATITPIVHIGRRALVVPPWLANFTMSFKQDGLWRRDSRLIAGLPVPSYTFTRIVDGQKRRDAAFADFLREAPPYFLIATPASAQRQAAVNDWRRS